MPTTEAVFAALHRWRADDEPAVLARVVGGSSSLPRELGAAMAISQSGRVVGSLSGGCIDGDVYALAPDVMASGTPVTSSYGGDTDDPFAPRLPCGGSVEVLVEPVDSALTGLLPQLVHAISCGDPVALVTLINATGGRRYRLVRPESAPHFPVRIHADAADPIVEHARALLDIGATQRSDVAAAEDRSGDSAVFIQSFVAPPQMLIFGANDYAAALSSIAKFLGYRVTLCDARSTFAAAERFPDADKIVVDRPDRFLARAPVTADTVICVLTHDHRFEVPLLDAALRTPAGYVGVMGSRGTHADRMTRLRTAGLTERQLARLAAPIGLDLGARTPEETAVSIIAEIVAERGRGSGARLSDLDLPIHHDTG